jgi:CHRD domain
MVSGRSPYAATAERYLKNNCVASERVGESEGRSPSGMRRSAIESRLMKRFAALLAVSLLATVPAALGAQAASAFRGRLAPVPVAAASPTITGVGAVTATLTGTKLTITGTFEGLATPVTFAKLHRAPKGIRGPAVFDLTVTPGTSGKISGSLDLSASQVEDLGRERFYVQLHSEKAPDGNLWGWLLVQEAKR